MRYKTQIGISIIVLLLMSQTYAMSWGHIGHYAIGREMRLLSAECGNMNPPHRKTPVMAVDYGRLLGGLI